MSPVMGGAGRYVFVRTYGYTYLILGHLTLDGFDGALVPLSIVVAA